MHGERVGRQHRVRVRRGQGHQHVSGEIRTTLVDHVLNHGIIMAGAGKRVLNVGRSTTSSIIQTFHRHNWYVKQQRIHPHTHTELLYVSPHTMALPHRGGKGPLLRAYQEEAMCAMVIANNAVRLRTILSVVMDDNNVFGNIQNISISTTHRVLKKQQINIKQKRNRSDRIKGLWYQYVQVKYLCVYTN